MVNAIRRTLRNAVQAFRDTAWRTWGWAAVAAIVFIPRVSLAQAPASAPVFTKDVAPILQEKCQACHRPGYIAPMAFMTYEETRPWARSIKARVAARQMPPWHIDKTVGIQISRTIVRSVTRRSTPSCGGSMPARRRATEGHAAAEDVRERRRLEFRRALRRSA